MRKIGIPEIEDIATGAALLGAGGGGDPYVGKLVAIGAVRDCGPVTLLDPEEVPDDALVVPIAMMGAPTVLAEKAIGGQEYQRLYDMVSRFFGKKIYAFMPIEAGGVNSMLPIAAAARLGLPLVDVDGMGRAFPELQMVTFTIGGINATPMALTDEKGNSVIFETITNKWTEELARSVTMSCGGSVSVSLYPMDGAQMKQYGVHGIVTRSQQLGAAIRTVKTAEDPEAHFLSFTEGYKLFKGKIADVLRETRAGFNFGRVVLEGIGECKGRSAAVEFQNENLTAEVDGKIVATVPDLICLVDTETFSPVTTDALLSGNALAAAFPISPLSALYPEDLAPSYRYEDAVEALADAGGDTGQRQALTLLVNEENSFRVACASFIAESLSLLDWQITVEALPWEAYLAALAAGEFDLYYGEVRLTADWDIADLVGSGGSLNYGGYANVVTDALLQAFTSSTDRSYAARQLCAHLLGTTPIAPVCFQQDTLLTHEGVAQGMSPTATSVFFGLENWTIHLEP